MTFDELYKDKDLLQDTGSPVVKASLDKLYLCNICGQTTAFWDVETGVPICSAECHGQFVVDYRDKTWQADVDAKDDKGHIIEAPKPDRIDNDLDTFVNLMNSLQETDGALAKQLRDATHGLPPSEALGIVYTALQAREKASRTDG